jgi:hypothetical protein
VNPCTACRHKKRAAIDRALLSGKFPSEVAKTFGLSLTSVHRHKKNHVLGAIEAAKAARAEAQVTTALAISADVETIVRDVVAKGVALIGEADGKIGERAQAMRAVLQGCELLAKLSGRLGSAHAAAAVVVVEKPSGDAELPPWIKRVATNDTVEAAPTDVASG